MRQPVIVKDGKEYRSWSPYTSKIAAFILEGGDAGALSSSSCVLYLGASYGTTVSHIADILPDATINCVEVAVKPYVGLQSVARSHRGIVPILEDANHPERYSAIAGSPDLLIEDVAQKNLADILVRNMECFHSISSFYLVVKARSIDSSARPEAVYDKVMRRLLSLPECRIELTDISRFEGDHAVISGSVGH